MDILSLRHLARQYYIFDGSLTETQLIRTIQVAQGSLDCFATPRVLTCGQIECQWRRDCQVACALATDAEP